MWLGYRPKINFFFGGGGLCLFVFYIVNLVIFASVVDTIKPVSGHLNILSWRLFMKYYLWSFSPFR